MKLKAFVKGGRRMIWSRCFNAHSPQLPVLRIEDSSYATLPRNYMGQAIFARMKALHGVTHVFSPFLKNPSTDLLLLSYLLKNT